MIERDILWAPWRGPGLEHLRLLEHAGGFFADGVIVAVAGEQAWRARYTIQCDLRWRVRELRIDMLDASNQRLDLMSDGAGHWSDGAGEALPGLVGCFDVDISATPFTNTLPIRRLVLAPGASADINVAYIQLPELLVQPEMQRYTCLVSGADASRYRFQARSSGFTAELPVDADGIVQDYPELFRRLMS